MSDEQEENHVVVEPVKSAVEPDWEEIKSLNMLDEFWPPKEKMPGDFIVGTFIGYKQINDGRVLMLENENGLIGVNESAALKNFEAYLGMVVKIEFIEQVELSATRDFNRFKAYHEKV